MLEFIFNKVEGLQPAIILKRDQQKCFPVKFAKLLRTTILKNIWKRLLLEVFYEKLFLETFTGQNIHSIHRTKVTSDKCSVKKVFLMVDRAVKVTCFYTDQHLLKKSCGWLSEPFLP